MAKVEKRENKDELLKAMVQLLNMALKQVISEPTKSKVIHPKLKKRKRIQSRPRTEVEQTFAEQSMALRQFGVIPFVS